MFLSNTHALVVHVGQMNSGIRDNKVVVILCAAQIAVFVVVISHCFNVMSNKIQKSAGICKKLFSDR